MAIVGDVNVSALGQVLERAFPARTAPSPPVAPRSDPARGASAWKDVRLAVPGASQDDVLVVWPADRSRPRDDAATAALLYLLGETGYAGRLGAALVEPGLVYSVEASLEGQGRSSFLAIRTACDPRDTPEVRRRIRAVLERAAQGRFTETEKMEAEAYLRGKAARQRDGSVSAAEVLLREATAPSVSHFTVADLNDVARRLFARGFPVVLVAGEKPQ